LRREGEGGGDLRDYFTASGGHKEGVGKGQRGLSLWDLILGLRIHSIKYF
jgi:hypothetical protein